MNTGTFKHSAHTTPRNDTGTGSGWFDQHLCCTLFRPLIMRNGSMHYRYLDEIFLCIFNTFCDRFLYFLGFSQSMTNHTVLIAHNDKGRKAECTTTLCSFHDAIDSRSEEHTSELQSRRDLVCRLLLEK